MRVDLMIEAYGVLVKIDCLGRGGTEGSGGGVLVRNVREYGQSRWGEAVRGDCVVGEGDAGWDAADISGEERIVDDLGAEVAGALAVVGNGDVEDEALTKTLAFVVDEEEGTVAPVVEVGDGDGAAEAAAELIALEDLAGEGEVGAGVELVVADELEEAAVITVGAGLGGGVEEGPPRLYSEE